MSPTRVAAALLALALAGFAGWRRHRLGRERLVFALLGAAALAVYASGLLSLLPDPKKAIIDVAQALGPWTYALVGLLAFLETGAFVGLVAPGETVVLAGGVIAGQGEIELLPLIGVVWTCAVLGDTASFFIGRRLGRRFLIRHGSKVKITRERIERVEGYFERHGGKTIVIGRFIGLVRALAPFVAGSSGLLYRRFIPYSVVGTGLWATLFCLLGYAFWQSFDRVATLAGQAVVAFGIVVGVAVGLVWAVRQLRDPEQRLRIDAWLDRQEQKPVSGRLVAAVRALLHRLAGAMERARSLELLELTTALAVAGVGGYMCVLYSFVIARDPGPTPLDESLMELVERLRSDLALDVVEVVTDFGAFPTAATVVFVVGVVLVARWRRVEAVALVAGLLLGYVAVRLMKAGFDRPRPVGSPVRISNGAFPSAHAAYSTAWVAAAVWLGPLMRLAARAWLVLGATLICAMVGLTRVYLRAHWFSDVAAGWGLGFAIFGFLAAGGLIVAHIRHNGAPWTSTSRSSRSPSP